MSILAYTGLPGSGKSYSVVEHQIIPALKAGRRIVTNLAVHADRLNESFPDGELITFNVAEVQGEPDKILELVTPGSVLVLDEVWRLFPAGVQTAKIPEAYKKLLAEHRHMVNSKGESCQIVLVTQDLAQISSFAVQLIEQTFRTVKLGLLGMNKSYRVDVFPGPVKGPSPSMQRRIREIYGRYRKEVFSYYNSHTMSEAAGEGGADESKIDKRGNLLRSPAFIAGGVIAVLLFVFSIRYAVRAFSGGKGSLLPTTSAPATKEPGRARAGGLTDGLSMGDSRRGQAAAQLQAWRVTGEISGEIRSYVFISNGVESVMLDRAAYCDRDVSGFVICQFEGQTISSQKRRIYEFPPGAVPSSGFSAPSDSTARRDGS
jgi:zona occludens toxin